MKTLIKKVYYCDFCKKKGLSHHSMVRHELICSQNPENNRPCYTCGNCKMQNILVEINIGDERGETVIRAKSIFFCRAKSTCIYPPQIEIKGRYYKPVRYENIPMPKTCDLYTLIS